MLLELGPQVPVESSSSNGTVFIKEVRAYCIDNPQDAVRRTLLMQPPQNVDSLSQTRDDTFVVQVELDNGMTGIGISQGGDAACFIVEKQLAKLVEGQDPSNLEWIWERMFRLTLQYGRQGIVMHAISAIDLAIWDVLGKLRRLPVYAILGGKTKEKLQVYARTLRPDLAKREGFHGAKIPLPYGPLEAASGMKQNVDLIRKWRRIVELDYPLMIQCDKELTLPYAVELAKKCEDFNVKWIEEAFPRSQQEAYSRLRDNVPTIPWTAGKHNYTRHDFKRLLEKQSCDILCIDVTTCGGLSEARKIVAMASAYDVSVIPCGSSSTYGYHLQMACSNCPIGEYIILEPFDNKVLKGYYDDILDGEPVPSNGYITLAHDKPGFGIELCCSNQVLKRPYNHPTKGEEMKQAAAQTLLAAALSPKAKAVSPAEKAAVVSPNFQRLQHPMRSPPSSPALVQKKPSPTKRTKNAKVKADQQVKYGGQPRALATTRAIGFRRYLSKETVDGLSYQESGDWCKKVGISLAGRKQERKDRLKEYLKCKPDGYKEY